MAGASSGSVPRRMDKRLLSRDRAGIKPLNALDLLGKTLRHWGYNLDLYNWRLKGRHPLKMDRVIEDIRQGDPSAGRLMLDDFAGNPHERAEKSPHELAEKGKKYWQATAKGPQPDHRFDFLVHLKAVADRRAAQRLSVHLTAAWCDRYLTWDHTSWRAETTAWRLVNWLTSIELVLGSDDLVYRSRVLLAVARQMRHLPRVVRDIANPVDRIAAGAALSLAGLLLPNGGAQQEQGFKVLKETIPTIVLADGAPKTRILPELITVFTLLTLVRRAALKADVVLPDSLQQAMDKIAPFLRATRSVDGRMTGLFSMPRGGDPLSIDALLEAAETPGQAGFSFPYGGLQRLAASGSVLLLDTGPCPKGPSSLHLAPSTGALEFMAGAEPLIGSIGLSTNPDFSPYCRPSAAFSGLVLDNRNTTEITETGLLGRGVELTETMRRSLKDGEEITLIHDGYARRLKVKVSRYIKLSKDGLVLSGKDTLLPLKGSVPSVPLDCWFHLPPGVVAQRSSDTDTAILLTTPSGRLWVFEATGASVSLVDSLYNQTPKKTVPAKAILLHQEKSGDPARDISWKLTRRE